GSSTAISFALRLGKAIMSRTASEFGRGMFAAALLLAVAFPAAAQDATAAVAQETAASPILSSQISVSRNDASLELELANGRRVRMQILDGRVLLDGRAIGEAARGWTLDRAWRELLDAAIDAPAA